MSEAGGEGPKALEEAAEKAAVAAAGEGEEDSVLLDISRAGVAVVTLNRPKTKNAFDRAMIDRLADRFETLRAADGVRVVFLEGAGDVFCAGADLNWMRSAANYTHEDNEDDALALARMLKKLRDLPQLTVAMAEGAAMGGGAGLIAACDVGVGLQNTRFAFSEVKLGLIPATIAPYVIAAVGPRQARALFATAEMFDAAYAAQIGLLHYVVPDKNAQAEVAEDLAKRAFEAGPKAVAAAKRLVDDVAGRAIDDGLLRETARRIADARASDEGKEGLAAFLEKRKPSWRG